MPSFNRNLTLFAVMAAAGLLAACQGADSNKAAAVTQPITDLPAVRLNYRFEADVPAPTLDTKVSEDRNSAVQADFDNNRPQEMLDRTLTSPDRKHIVAVYHRSPDLPSEFRLDMYTPDGQQLKKLTSDVMAVHFPETIQWSPNSNDLAFVAMLRAGGTSPSPTPTIAEPAPSPPDPNAPEGEPSPSPSPSLAPTPAAPSGILSFRTEQIYLSSADGANVRPLTTNEGLIYFFYTWSPDSTMLVALASTAREWKYQDVIANSKNEVMVPQGRPRVIEKNGRERRLDDNQTNVHPVWSPDSTKVAEAFENQVRIYDAVGTNPTQAAIPLRNQLLIASQAYDQDQQRKAQAGNADGGTTAQPTPNQPLSTLPDEKLLVSYNPIVDIEWPQEGLVYVQTAYVKRMKIEVDSVRSFARWHRLALSGQVVVGNNRS